jgi:hypothetical protein
MATQIVPKKSSIAGRIPTSDQLGIGEILQNLTDRCLYSKDAAGNVYRIGTRPVPTKVEVFDLIGSNLFYGKLAYADFPNSGSIYDSPLWDIARTTTDANGNVTAEASALGQWSSKTNLQFS